MVVCVDLGATEIKVCAFPQQNNEFFWKKFPTNAQNGKKGILAALHAAIKSCQTPQTEAISIATAGNVDEQRGIISYATDNLPGMTGFDIAAFCQENFHLPTIVMNDAHAALLGEAHFGSAKGLAKRIVMLTLGSGVGGAYLVDGKILSNSQNDFCRFGHLTLVEGGYQCTCGKKGCVECYLSGRAIHRIAAQRGIDDDVFGNFQKGVAPYVELVQQFRQHVVQTLRMVQAICPFDVCVVGGGVVHWMGDAFSQIFQDLPFTVVAAQLGNGAGLFGAYANYLAKEDKL